MEIEIVLDGARDYKILLDELPRLSFQKKVLIVTNNRVSGLHLRYLLERLECKELFIHTMNDGEEYKNLSTLEGILESAFNARLDRKSLFIAFGGGVVGDITGFAAGIYQRGVDFIQIPTTLLSQVDASVGGKTGINNKFGKNLIGIFNQPKAVYIDTHLLSTLPSREFGAGVAEIVKMGVMFDRAFFEVIEKESISLKNQDSLKNAIKRSVELKAQTVSSDEREEGVRAVLNYGHTFAHVIENLTNYKTFLHGEAVAIGMCMANTLALNLGLLSSEESNRIEQVLQKHNLPTRYKIDSPESFYDKFFLDKKSNNAKIKFILPKGIGNYEMRDDIPKNIVLAALEQFC